MTPHPPKSKPHPPASKPNPPTSKPNPPKSKPNPPKNKLKVNKSQRTFRFSPHLEIQTLHLNIYLSIIYTEPSLILSLPFRFPAHIYT